jgi:hypothetical protein
MFIREPLDTLLRKDGRTSSDAGVECFDDSRQ